MDDRKVIKLQIGDECCYTMCNGFSKSEERYLEKCVKEMFLNILYRRLDFNARIYKLECALSDALHILQRNPPTSEPEYHVTQECINRMLDTLNDKGEA